MQTTTISTTITAFDAPARPMPRVRPRLCVLGSGSAGNCSVVELDSDPAGPRRAMLIDLGLSPKRTWSLLERVGLCDRGACEIEAIVLTHLDHDHAHAGWASAIPAQTRVHLHKRHAGRAERMGLLHRRCELFEGAFEVGGLAARSVLMAHDELGVAVLRFDAESGGPTGTTSLGFATDLGRVSDAMIDLLTGVDVLAIESNYCPELQEASARPAFLKRRIMDGRGHLSNAECVDAVHRIAPREHVVLLHLSRDCNRPELVAEHHAGADYSVTIASQDEPTRWVRVGPAAS
ncbi:MAG: MBL fold metallo-hydrolase [Planctomycetota bacterium]|nr:MBL fold metallo-hydrolase [Planctomycetota bacterium]